MLITKIQKTYQKSTLNYDPEIAQSKLGDLEKEILNDMRDTFEFQIQKIRKLVIRQFENWQQENSIENQDLDFRKASHQSQYFAKLMKSIHIKLEELTTKAKSCIACSIYKPGIWDEDQQEVLIVSDLDKSAKIFKEKIFRIFI